MPIRKTLLIGLLGLVIAACALYLLQAKNIKEYQLYLSEDRPGLTLSFDELSEEWSETDLKARFHDVRVDCHQGSPNPGMGERTCFIDINRLNGNAAMMAAFHFKDGKLNSASFNAPWWSHAPSLRHLEQQHGAPLGSQNLFHSGVRLIGWHLNNGSAVFYNRERPANLLGYNSIFWQSARQCQSQTCFSR
ncbi:hypothetical protein [Aquabacterium sp.]|uniref:hypothetical protein n=1 Tax=Aquabacterium sp. TaxID=1872578 RepID=UPI0019B95026|nr:hypothetical protein [Aquabacterium sp.]MBC7699525.1 hypothetical protein [Aquabacterium sp.]